MVVSAKGVLTRHRQSFEAGRDSAAQIAAALLAPPKVVFAYLTVNHEQDKFLAGVREVLGPNVPVVGCSGQGVMGRGAVYEDGYAASVLGLGGDSVEVATALARDVAQDTKDKGESLARSLRAQVSRPLKAVVLHYDPLSGVDLDTLMGAMDPIVECPILGGAAAHYFNAAMTTTYQYFGNEVFSRGAVAVGLTGDFTAETVVSTGCAPVGYELTLTRAQGNMILELDGRPALEVWREVIGATGAMDLMLAASVAIGVPRPGGSGHMMRAAFVFDAATRGMLVGAAIPEGTVLTLYHRTTEDALNGAERMAHELENKLQGKKPRAVLGFECGGRTRPFLGVDATNTENQAIQKIVGKDLEWAGPVCWGELFPVDGKPGFHNYTYPLLALAD